MREVVAVLLERINPRPPRGDAMGERRPARAGRGARTGGKGRITEWNEFSSSSCRKRSSATARSALMMAAAWTAIAARSADLASVLVLAVAAAFCRGWSTMAARPLADCSSPIASRLRQARNLSRRYHRDAGAMSWFGRDRDIGPNIHV